LRGGEGEVAQNGRRSAEMQVTLYCNMQVRSNPNCGHRPYKWHYKGKAFNTDASLELPELLDAVRVSGNSLIKQLGSSVCMHEISRERMKEFSLNLILGNFTKKMSNNFDFDWNGPATLAIYERFCALEIHEDELPDSIEQARIVKLCKHLLSCFARILDRINF
jgi:hypothetical protein